MRSVVSGQNMALVIFYGLLISGCGNLGVQIDKTNGGNSTAVKKKSPDKDVEDDFNGNDGNDGDGIDLDGDGHPDDGSDLPNLGYQDWCRPRYADGSLRTVPQTPNYPAYQVGVCDFGYLVQNESVCRRLVGGYLWYCNVRGDHRRFNNWICCGPV